MNNKVNNKGFTLVELIIAITILSIVLGLGYKVIIGTNKATKHQTQVFSEQQNANLINKYLTKDLEQAINFTPADTTSNPYIYVINDGVSGTEKIEYRVEKTTDGKFYDLTRIEDGTSIKLISNYPTNSDVPFSISQVENSNNIFKVILNGKGKDYEVGKYEFEVTSRVEVIEMANGDIGSDDTGSDDTESDDTESDDTESGVTGSEVVYDGSLYFDFDKVTNGNSYKIYALANLTSTDHNSIKLYERSITTNIQGSQKNTYDVTVTIPPKDGNNLTISVPKFGINNDLITNDSLKNIFNNGIRIYSGEGSDIIDVTLGDNADFTKGDDGKYYIPLEQSDDPVKLSIKINVTDFTTVRSLSIQFGTYYDNY